jgi:hypothetical protein
MRSRRMCQGKRDREKSELGIMGGEGHRGLPYGPRSRNIHSFSLNANRIQIWSVNRLRQDNLSFYIVPFG